MLKKCILFITIVFILSLLPIRFVSAITIGVNPPSLDVLTGDSFNISIDIYGLGDCMPDSLSTFDMDLSFDSAIFGNQLDIIGLGSRQKIIPGIGTINLFELPFDYPGDLDLLQVGSFTFVILTFDSLTLGLSPLNISVNSEETDI